MNYESIYITVRLDVESPKEIDDEKVDEIISQCDYLFTSRTDDVVIDNTEICGINWENNEL